MEEIKNLLSKNLSNQFLCKAAGRDTGEFVASTLTVLEEAADPLALDTLKAKLKEFAGDFSAFYSIHNGVLFHRDTLSDAAGLQIHPIEDWDEVTELMKEWYEFLDQEQLEEADVDWLESGIAFAEVPHSGNYFVIALQGNSAGKIIYSDHDGLESEPYADSLFEFMQKYLEAPEKEMYNLGCYTRYSDGKTSIQWIPEEPYSS